MNTMGSFHTIIYSQLQQLKLLETFMQHQNKAYNCLSDRNEFCFIKYIRQRLRIDSKRTDKLYTAYWVTQKDTIKKIDQHRHLCSDIAIHEHLDLFIARHHLCTEAVIRDVDKDLVDKYSSYYGLHILLSNRRT